MNYPFVSIIIPAKNEDKVIGKCFSALLNIEYPKNRYEIILVDNGSTDGTINVASDYNIKCYVKPEITISALRNFGANMAQGDILAFVDADVIVSLGWLECAIRVLEDNKNVGCTGSSPEIPSNPTWVEKTWHQQAIARKNSNKRNWIASMNLIVRKEAFYDIQGFNEKMLTCEDVDFCYRLSKKWDILYDHRIKAVHLGEAKTLYQLFKKESWRGIGNYFGIRSHGINIGEFPSHIVATYNFIYLIAIPLFIYEKKYLYAVFLTSGCIGIAMIYSIVISKRTKNYKYLLQLILVWIIYGFGRGFSIFRIFLPQLRPGKTRK